MNKHALQNKNVLLEEKLAAMELKFAKEQERRELEQQRREEAEKERDRLRITYEKIYVEYEKLRRQLFAQKAEKAPKNEAQLSLLTLMQALGRLDAGEPGAEEDAKLATSVARKKIEALKTKKKSSHGRRNLADTNLPIERIVVEPLDKEDSWVKIGEEVTRHIGRRPSQIVCVELVYPKYKTPSAGIVMGQTRSMPLPKSYAGPSLLAHVLVSKYADHLPLHRLEKIFTREGFRISRQTLSDWVRDSTTLLNVLTDAMWRDIYDAPWIATDATGVLVQNKERCKLTNFYTLIAANKHVLFKVLKKNDGDAVADLLKGYSGYLLADASTVYHELYRREDIVEVGCWAHARRKFFEALHDDKERAMVGIGFIGLLFDAQRKTYDAKTKRADTLLRAEMCRPILRKFWAWLNEQRDQVPCGSPIRKAMNYLVNQRRPLLRFLRDGQLRLDNNISELELRRIVVGRKNWLFCGSDNGAEWNAVATSLIASCQMHDVEPSAYLRDVLTLLPSWDQTKVLELSPLHWRQTLARSDVKEKLNQLRVMPVDDDITR